MSLKEFNVILVQNNPRINQWENNIKEIESLLNKRKKTKEPLDILVFPECALTGY
jgi:predicted amidohydrolase